MPIRHSVGSGGRNIRGDVYYVQFLLSDYRCRASIPPIKVDGIVGPKTIGAIKAFQEEFTSVVDGRVDPGGPTIAALERAHLAGISSIEFTPAAKRYLRASVPVTLMVQRVYAAYLNKLRDGMGEGPAEKHKESPSPALVG
jgi:peptidoglycan hydrolase-like protein with peptidoglycan-binding domain